MLDSLAALVLRSVPPSRLSVLIYHRVLAVPDPLLPNEPAADEFERTMKWVRDAFNVIPLAEGVAALKDGRLPTRALSITFDDGYANNESVAAPILARLGLHATFFIATGFLDGGRMFNDTVIETVRGFTGTELDLNAIGLGCHDTIGIEQRRRAIDAILMGIKYRPEADRAYLAERVGQISGVALPENLMMTSEQASNLARMGFALGGHTVTHPILAQVDIDVARREIEEGRRFIEELSGGRVGLFAYPNGKPNRDYGMAAARLVRELGFDGAVSTSRGAARVGSDPYQIPRFTPWNARPLHFAAQIWTNLARVAPAYATA